MSQAHDNNSSNGNPVEYWRSLRHRKMDPAYREMLEREFPEGVEKPFNMNRRSFLTLMGASLALAGLASCRRPEEKIVPYVSRPEGVIPGTVQKYATSMPFGTECFTLLGDSREGRPVHVSGNDANPLTGRSSNVWANASILDLYDPDRSQFVLHNGAESSIATFANAWKTLAEKHVVDKGEGLAVLSGAFASPTLHRLRIKFLERYPSARWIAYEPVDDENIRRGMQTAFGRTVQPVYDFRRADIVLAIDADFLGTESRSLVNARGFAERRRVVEETDSMNRLYLVESSLTQTTTMADHRLVMPASQMYGFLLAVADELRNMGLTIPGRSVGARSSEEKRNWIRAVASDLVRAGKSALVLAGRKQPPHVHALVAAINKALGNAGTTVAYKKLPFALVSDTNEFVSLISDMKAGKVKTLVVLDTNPVYFSPPDLDVRAAMEAVETVVQLSTHVDETSPFAAWHVPRHHYLESWGDVGSVDGFVGVIQPLIAPLYHGMSVVEIAGLLAGDSVQKGYDLVRETWSSFLPGASFEKEWEKVLHDGLLEFEIQEEKTDLDAMAVHSLLVENKPETPSLSARNLEIVFQPSPAVFDGRFANIGWLQEFPDPVTKLTWDNAAVMSAGTAQALGLENNDLVRLSFGGREIALPVWIMPGQADFSVGVTLGYGRKYAGRIGNKVGGNGYRLRTYAKPYFDTGLKLSSRLGKHELACVQDHHGLDTEKIARKGIQRRLPQLIREATLDEYRRKPDFVDEIAETPDLQSMLD
ncbi:MAG: TAT-variant-translocated molybdopterin oxidoreductase, partial [Chlorobi bacterium]|nr:TAT-variant-translocated molybdopterin oxidoreductase [Chlorobiota bacterium]